MGMSRNIYATIKSKRMRIISDQSHYYETTEPSM